MAIIRKKQLREMGVPALEDKLFEMRRELNSELGMVATGGRSQNPGRIHSLRKTVARILTYITQKNNINAGKGKAQGASAGKTQAGAKKQR